MLPAPRGSSQDTYTYTYDGDGRRVKKSSGSTGTLYWQDLGGSVIQETDLTGNTYFNRFVFFNGQRIARRDANGAVRYYFSDHLGTTAVITNETGGIVEESHHYPYGGERVVLDGDPNPYKFTGKERDAESGLDYFGARYYGSNVGRFTTVDPLAKSAIPALPQTWNRYSYALNNPLRFLDPTGKCSAPSTQKGQQGGCTAIYLTPKAFTPTKGGAALPVVVSGDGRQTTGTDKNASSRGEVKWTYDKKNEDLKIVGTSAAASKVSVPFGDGLVSLPSIEGRMTASVTKGTNADGDTTFTVKIQATNGFADVGVPGAPAPADATLNFVATDSGLQFTGGTADPFFSLEGFTYDENGNIEEQFVDQQETLELNDLEQEQPIETPR